jgi:hypothetical protein
MILDPLVADPREVGRGRRRRSGALQLAHPRMLPASTKVAP